MTRYSDSASWSATVGWQNAASSWRASDVRWLMCNCMQLWWSRWWRVRQQVSASAIYNFVIRQLLLWLVLSSSSRLLVVRRCWQ